MNPQPPEYDQFTQNIVQAVSDWTDHSRSFPNQLVTQLRNEFPSILVDGQLREKYLKTLRKARRESKNERALDRWVHTIEIPTESLLQTGLQSLTDEQLIVMAVEPFLIHSVAELIDEFSLTNGLSSVWWQTIYQAGQRVIDERGSTPPFVPTLLLGERFRRSAEILRSTEPSALLAGGSAEEFVRQWVEGQFVLICLESEPNGLAILERLQRPSTADDALLNELIAFLASRSRFALLQPEELELLATAIQRIFDQNNSGSSPQ